MSQQVLDHENASFWNTLCGWGLAQQAGITGESEGDLRRFDELYMDFYPYLERYLPGDFGGKKVLEIGLGFGTLGQVLASRGADYHGVDIAAEPVEMMRRRMHWLGAPEEQVQQASVLELPYEDGTFDFVYTIGCLHHTGDLPRSVDEVYRVLRPGGRAMVMLYHANSFRRLLVRAGQIVKRKDEREREEQFRKMYDADEAGTPAPHTDFVTRSDVRRLFHKFASVKIEPQNFDGYRFGLRRELFLSNLARVVGLDLYIVADK
jgi:SAM-dependent methyltransferase